MTASPPNRLNLMLIDSDPVFSQGLVDCLNQDPSLQVVLEAASSTAALQALKGWFLPAGRPGQEDAVPPRTLDVVLISLDLGPTSTGNSAAIALCQEIHSRYAWLPILTISAQRDPIMLAAALQAGAMGFCQKGTVLPDIIIAIRQVAAGYAFWDQGMETVTQALMRSPTGRASTALTSGLTGVSRRAWATLRHNLRTSGLRQIESAIEQLNLQLADPASTPFDQLFLTGRRRELRAARWLVKRLLTTPEDQTVPQPDAVISSQAPQATSAPPAPPGHVPPPSSAAPVEPSPIPTALSRQPSSTQLRSVQSALFDNTFAKVQAPLRNLTDSPLEIDILREDKKRELLSIVLKKLEEMLDELRFSQLELSQLIEKYPAVLLDLWETSIIEFFGRYATLTVGSSPTEQWSQPPIEIVEVLRQDAAIVQAEILNRIPLVPDFLAHLLYQMPLMVDDTPCNVGTIEAMSRMELLLQNLMIQVANGAIQPLLNRFGDVVAIKQTFYDRRLLSSREIERFRNNLSWKYRIQRLFQEPTAIFESRYELMVLQAGGITKIGIYSPRNQELDALTGVQLAVTLALEARDAISPRFRSAISFVGSGVVYILTEVVGRGIGLIGRGIIKGIGTALQDTRFSRGGDRQ